MINITAEMVEKGARACSQWRGDRKYPFPTYDDLSQANKEMYAEQALSCLVAALSETSGD